MQLLPSSYGKPPRGPIQTKNQSVYVMQDLSGFFKIGRASDTEQRRAQLQTGNPQPIFLIGATEIDSGGICPVRFESMMHELLHAFRISGEWFKVSDAELYKAWKFTWTFFARPKITERFIKMKAKRNAV